MADVPSLVTEPVVGFELTVVDLDPLGAVIRTAAESDLAAHLEQPLSRPEPGCSDVSPRTAVPERGLPTFEEMLPATRAFFRTSKR